MYEEQEHRYECKRNALQKNEHSSKALQKNECHVYIHGFFSSPQIYVDFEHMMLFVLHNVAHRNHILATLFSLCLSLSAPTYSRIHY